MAVANTSELSTGDISLDGSGLATEAQIGEVQASPTANTVLDRLKTIAASLVTLHGDVDGLEGKDYATQTTLAAVLAKLSADPATQTTLAAILAKQIAAPATEAKQDAANTKLDTLATLLGSGVTTVRAKIDCASSGAGNTIVAAAGASTKIYVVAYSLIVTGDVSVQWFTGTSASLSGAMSFKAGGGMSARGSIKEPLLETVANEALKLTLGSGVQVSGHVTYYTGP